MHESEKCVGGEKVAREGQTTARGALLETVTYRLGASLVDLFGGDGGESEKAAEKEKRTVPFLLAILFFPFASALLPRSPRPFLYFPQSRCIPV